MRISKDGNPCRPGRSDGTTLSRWRRVGVRMAIAFAGAFALLFVVERGLRGLFPFPRHLLDRLEKSVRVYAADGTLMYVGATRAHERVIPVPLHSMSPQLRRVLLHSEDGRFFDHHGVDGVAVVRAAAQNVMSGQVVSGASTITMQVARIVMSDKSRSLTFKFEQAFRARQLEGLFDKEEILEIYCNHVPLGGAVRGFEAAARRWFGVGADRLTLSQAATLVAMLPAPGYRCPRRRPELVTRLRDRLLARMRDSGELTGREYLDAVSTPLGARRRPWPSLAPHACRYFVQRSLPKAILRTGLDLDLQRRIQALAARDLGRSGDGIAIVVLDRSSRGVRAMVGSADYRITKLNTATRRRSVGSTLKPFLFALGLECGALGLRSVVSDTPIRIGDYRPANFSRDYLGAIDMGDALASSRNPPAVRLLQAVGVDRFADLLRRLGLPIDRRGVQLDAALGTMSASPLQLATAYCRFIGSGSRIGVRPATVSRVLDTLSRQPIGDGVPDGVVAFKTGTSSGRRDAWCVGITAHDVAVVWMGNLSGRGEPDMVGGDCAMQLMTRVVASL